MKMAQRILKCNCGCEIPIRDTQAGVQLQCPQCNITLAVPSLRDLKNLPLAAPPPPPPWFAFLPERSLPRSPWRLGLGIFFLTVSVVTPVLIASGQLERAYSGLANAHVHRAFFQLNNPALWVGLFALAMSGLLSLIRGLGYPLGGRRRH